MATTTTAANPNVINGAEKNNFSRTGYGSGTGGSYGAGYPTRIANPGPLGLFSFAATMFMYSLYTVNTRGVTHANVIVGMALFMGGLVEFLAGMWEFPRGNVFGATVFASYGAFWMSLATILIPASGISAAYSSQQELSNALGIYYVTWMMITIFFVLGALRRSISSSVFLSLFAISLALFTAAQFTQKSGVRKAAGAFGILTALTAFYIALSELIASETTPLMRLPVGPLGSNRHAAAGYGHQGAGTGAGGVAQQL